MNKLRVFCIGANGKWFLETYYPAISKSLSWLEIVGIADLDETISDKTPFFDSKVVKLTGHISDYEKIEKEIKNLCPDIVVIASPPVTHYHYSIIALRNGADIICDKPPVAVTQQFSKKNANISVRDKFRLLLNGISASRHIRHRTRCCHFFIPLRRRIHYPYSQITNWIKEVREATTIVPTTIDLSFNDGSFRFHREFDRPGAHGYREGFGILTHTGYHFIDFLAMCITQDITDIESIEASILSARTTDYVDGPSEIAFARLLDDQGDWISLIPNHSCYAEADARVSYNITLRDKQTSRVYLSLAHSGCTRRMSSRYDESTTHDEARVDDLVLMLQQGPFQSIQLMISDDSGGRMPYGFLRLIRRLHPLMANKFGVPELSMLDNQLFPGDAGEIYRNIVVSFLDACKSPASINSEHPLHRYLLPQQEVTNELYASCLGKQREVI